jgi:hypothetical protein
MITLEEVTFIRECIFPVVPFIFRGKEGYN